MKVHLLCLATLLLASCAGVRKTETAKTLEIYGPGVIQNPVIADLQVKEQKVSGTASGSSRSVGTLKNMAMVDAIKKAQADVLVGPTFEIEMKGSKATATVTGFPATYKNFRTASEADSLLVRASFLQGATSAVVDEKPPRKKGAAGLVAGIALVFTALIIGLASGAII